MPTYLRVVVDVELGSTLICGRIGTSDDPARPFHGWLELAGTIEALRNAAPSPRECGIVDEPPDRQSSTR